MAKYKIDNNHMFINPYNFVTFSSKSDRVNVENKDNNNLLSGVLKCRLVVKTPLAIPEIESAKMIKANGHKAYDFYSIDGIPAIPGSSIRGVLRSTFEAASDSCFVTLPKNEKEKLTERVLSSQVYSAGVLIKENGRWSLRKAERLRLPNKNWRVEVKNSERVIKNGNEIFVNGEYVDAVAEKKGRAYEVTSLSKSFTESKYVLYIGEEIRNKSYESVFEVKGPESISEEQLKNALDGLLNTREIYRNPRINKKYADGGHTGYKNFDNAYKNGVVPIWYKHDGDNWYFSMAAIGRKTFSNSVNDLITDKRVPCNNRKALCPACSLFGMTSNDSYGSRIRITDAFASEKFKASNHPVTLKELGSPRPGYYLFYGLDGKAYDMNDANIAGRKFYWHIPKAVDDASIYTETNSKNITERNSSCVLALPGSEFKFDIFYDGISEEQYKQLLWTVTLGDNSSDSDYCHKFGHGKPLGLGSAKIVVDNNVARTFSLEEGYKCSSEVPSNIEFPTNFSTEIWGKMKYIMSFSFTTGYDVRYPYISVEGMENRNDYKENDLANHKWFTENSARRKNGPDPKVLPRISANPEKLLLPAFSLVTSNIDCNHSKKENSSFKIDKKDVTNVGELSNGKIIFFNHERGFGKIASSNGKEIFLHCSQFKGKDISELVPNANVEFSIRKGNKGLEAMNCRIKGDS